MRKTLAAAAVAVVLATSTAVAAQESGDTPDESTPTSTTTTTTTTTAPAAPDPDMPPLDMGMVTQMMIDKVSPLEARVVDLETKVENLEALVADLRADLDYEVLYFGSHVHPDYAASGHSHSVEWETFECTNKHHGDVFELVDDGNGGQTVLEHHNEPYHIYGTFRWPESGHEDLLIVCDDGPAFNVHVDDRHRRPIRGTNTSCSRLPPAGVPIQHYQPDGSHYSPSRYGTVTNEWLDANLPGWCRAGPSDDMGTLFLPADDHNHYRYWEQDKDGNLGTYP